MLRPSDAHLWARCSLAGSLITSGEYYITPDPEPWNETSDSKREGECAHWAADMVFKGYGTARDLIGAQHRNGWIIDEEMAGHVQDYVDYVLSFGPVTASELTITLFDAISGRLDTVVSNDTSVVRVFDFKYGWRIVEADENYGMLCYGLAVSQRDMVDVELHVYQPRPNHPLGVARVWRIPAEDNDEWAEWLWTRASDCIDNPRGTVGAHCLNCPAAGSCHALTANVYGVFETVEDHRVTDMTGDQLGAFLTFLWRAEKLVKAKKEAIEAEMEARLKQGSQVPGWALHPRTGNRRFTVDADRVRLATGIDPFKAVMMSPSELEREGVPKHVVALITERPTIGRKLTNSPSDLMDALFGKPEGK